jgi:hypothetical protein
VIAALPSFEKLCTFARWLLVGECVKAATTQSRRTLAAMVGHVLAKWQI